MRAPRRVPSRTDGRTDERGTPPISSLHHFPPPPHTTPSSRSLPHPIAPPPPKGDRRSSSITGKHLNWMGVVPHKLIRLQIIASHITSCEETDAFLRREEYVENQQN
mmetsp:Transcript_12334/g.30368  ORF Transcript_12334/g.30368 Transcript_12334/m.30368 type:complete len:107 (-) Transcript_12334:1510-1830(-)